MIENQSPIAFFDSGIGGLPYLDVARAKLPNERFVYLADRQGFPYGKKTHEEVIERVVKVTKTFVEEIKAKLLVVACNTATEHAIDYVREEIKDIPVVGTVPAIKPAALLSKKHSIGVVATEAAVRAQYLDRLTKQWASSCTLTKIGDGRLVEFIEHRMLNATQEECLDIVRPSCEALIEAGSDVIILGCTHFVHLADEFKTVANGRALIIDSREGIANRVVDVLPCKSSFKNGQQDAMLLTGKEEFSPMFFEFAKRFGLKSAGTFSI